MTEAQRLRKLRADAEYTSEWYRRYDPNPRSVAGRDRKEQASDILFLFGVIDKLKKKRGIK